MGTEQIVEEINKLPISQRLTVIELTIKNLKQENKRDKLLAGADHLYNDYVTDAELTTFSNLDREDFYEAR
ncbi:hypothetical protein ACFQ3S_19575 [Mucilaginibacter terrae]|uniref:hypothetical protein n=1 Tax=Mucilaginibacter terrae TaxID=1955052 RepID=UPI00363B8D7B